MMFVIQHEWSLDSNDAELRLVPIRLHKMTPLILFKLLPMIFRWLFLRSNGLWIQFVALISIEGFIFMVLITWSSNSSMTFEDMGTGENEKDTVAFCCPLLSSMEESLPEPSLKTSDPALWSLWSSKMSFGMPKSWRKLKSLNDFSGGFGMATLFSLRILSLPSRSRFKARGFLRKTSVLMVVSESPNISSINRKVLEWSRFGVPWQWWRSQLLEPNIKVPHIRFKAALSCWVSKTGLAPRCVDKASNLLRVLWM